MTVPDFPSVLYTIPGAATDEGCTLAIGVPQDAAHRFDIYLGISTEAASSVGFPGHQVTFTAAPLAPDPNGMAFHRYEGLRPGTVYHVGLSRNRSSSKPEWIGDPIRFRTLHNEHSTYPISVKYAYGSCQVFHGNPDGPRDPHHGGPLQVSWRDLQAFLPDVLFDTGDFHYQGSNPGGRYGDTAHELAWKKMYWDQIAGLPDMRRARALVVEDQLGDDHEFSRNNGESQYPSSPPAHGDHATFLTGPERRIQMRAMQQIFAMYHLEEPSRGMWGSYLLTPHVRVVVVDCESLDRTYSQERPDSKRTFLGDAQTRWLQSVLTDSSVTVNLVIASKAWLGDTQQPAFDPGTRDDRNRDKVWMYGSWRDSFVSWLRDHPQVNLVWMGGDRHACCWDDGTNNKWGGFPTTVGSGWSEFQLRSVHGEAYRYSEPTPAANPPPKNSVSQYIRGVITDNHDGTVEMTTEIRFYDFLAQQMKSLPDPAPHRMSLDSTHRGSRSANQRDASQTPIPRPPLLRQIDSPGLMGMKRGVCHQAVSLGHGPGGDVGTRRCIRSACVGRWPGVSTAPTMGPARCGGRLLVRHPHRSHAVVLGQQLGGSARRRLVHLSRPPRTRRHAARLGPGRDRIDAHVRHPPWRLTLVLGRQRRRPARRR